MAFMLSSAAAQNVGSEIELAQATFVQQIIVEGTERIEPGTVKSYLLIREGDQYDIRRVDRSLKSLFATGLFADVSIRRQGATLIVRVVENPVINRIAFEGNKALDTENLETEILLRSRVIYTRSKVQADVKRLLTIYRLKGRFAVTIEPKVIQLPQNRIDLVFEIAEGDPTEIRSVKFVGNREFSDRRLQGIVETKESVWYRVFSSNTVYDPDRVTLDREMLRRFYLSEGFADFRVSSAVAELTPNRKDFFITYTVDEGTRYAFGEIKVLAKLRDLKPEQIKAVVDIEKGDWYDITQVDSSLDAITDKVGELGFAFVDVRPRVKRDREKKIINITFEIKEGPRVFVERIDISGNVRTLDKVIRREFQLIEGDAFNSAKIRRSRQRLRNLGFFETINVTQIPGSAPDKAVVKVEVQEKSTGSISIGAGFSSSVGTIGELALTERNFLGRGQRLDLKLSLASKRSQIDLSFTEPYFLDREVSAGIDIFQVRQNLQDTNSIDTSKTGLRLRAGYRLTDDLTQSWSYTIRRQKIDDVGTGAAELIKAEIGTEYASEIGHKISFASRSRTKSGYDLSLRTDMAGLGGTLKHIRNVFDASYFIPVADEWILSIGGRTGYIVGLGEDVHFRERFFLGGEQLRGFENGGVGPRDLPTKDGLGGEWLYTGSVELKFPLGLPNEFGINGRVFTDLGSTGQLTPKDSNTQDTGSLRASTGLGLTWDSPFGPVGMDAAIPLVKEDFDITEFFRVNFGARF